MAKKSKEEIASLRSNIGIELSDVLDNAQEIANQIETNYHPRKQFTRALGNRTQEYISYNPETRGFIAHFRDENGVLYEISVLKR